MAKQSGSNRNANGRKSITAADKHPITGKVSLRSIPTIPGLLDTGTYDMGNGYGVVVTKENVGTFRRPEYLYSAQLQDVSKGIAEVRNITKQENPDNYKEATSRDEILNFLNKTKKWANKQNKKS